YVDHHTGRLCGSCQPASARDSRVDGSQEGLLRVLGTMRIRRYHERHAGSLLDQLREGILLASYGGEIPLLLYGAPVVHEVHAHVPVPVRGPVDLDAPDEARVGLVHDYVPRLHLIE